MTQLAHFHRRGDGMGSGHGEFLTSSFRTRALTERMRGVAREPESSFCIQEAGPLPSQG